MLPAPRLGALAALWVALPSLAAGADPPLYDVPAPPGPVVGMLHLGSAETALGETTWSASLVLGDEAVVVPRNPLWDGGCVPLMDERTLGAATWTTGPSGLPVERGEGPLLFTPRGGGDALSVPPRRTPDGTLWGALFRERDGALYAIPGRKDPIWRSPLPGPGRHDVAVGGAPPWSAPGAVRVQPRPTGLQVPESVGPGSPLTVRWDAGSPGARVVVAVVPAPTTGRRGVQCTAPDSGAFTLAAPWVDAVDAGSVDVIVSRNAWSYVPRGAGWVEVASTMSTSRATTVLPRREPPEPAPDARRPSVGGERARDAASPSAAAPSPTAGAVPSSPSASAPGFVVRAPVRALIEEVVDRSEDAEAGPATRTVRMGFGADVEFVALGSPEACLLFGDDSPLRGVTRDDDWSPLGAEVGLIDLGGARMPPSPEDRGPRYLGTLPAPAGPELRVHTKEPRWDLTPVLRVEPARDVTPAGPLVRGAPVSVEFTRPADGAHEALVLVGFDAQLRPYSVACPPDRPIPGEWTAPLASPWAEVWVLRWTHAIEDGPHGPVGVTVVQRARTSAPVVAP